jgi:S-adenosylmethionine synthetase
LISVAEQSPEKSQEFQKERAHKEQELEIWGLMLGYDSNETPEVHALTILHSHKLKRLLM